MLYNSGSMWPSIVVHEHWPVSQRMIVEMGDYTWSEHIVTVFLACQITIKNVQVQLTVKGKTTPDSYTPTPKSCCAQNVVVLAWPLVGRNKKRLSSDQWTRLHVRIVHPKWSCDQSNGAWWWRNVNCGRFIGCIPWWWRRLITVCVLMWPPNAKLPRSAPAVLNGRCGAYLDMNRSYLGVVLRGLPSRGRSVTFPVWRKRCISRTMMEWLTLKFSATLQWLRPPLYMPTAYHLSGMVNVRRTIPNQLKMKLKTLHTKNQLSFTNTNVGKYTWHFTHPAIYT
jgi:hypothetical protein